MSFTFCVFARSGNPFLFRKFIARRMKGHAPLLSLDPYVDRVPNALVFHENSFGPKLRANQRGELKLQSLRSGRQSLARAVIVALARRFWAEWCRHHRECFCR